MNSNLIRSYFLPALIVYSVVVTVAGAMLLPFTPHMGIWVAVTVATAQITLYFAWLYLANVPRTSPGLMGFTIGIFAATMYSIYTSYDQQVASAAPLLALIALSGWMAYVGWYSDLGNRSKEGVRLGKNLPSLELEDYDGNPLRTSDWKGQKRLVIFYQGNWCPICTAQVNELSQFEEQFKQRGLRITLISPQPHELSRRHAKRVGMDYDFLVDVDNRAARKLGILNEHGLPKGFEVLGYDSDVPKPTTFVLDEAGKVVFADLPTNYRLRTRPQDILSALDE